MGPKIYFSSLPKLPKTSPISIIKDKNVYEGRFVRISKTECKSYINKSNNVIETLLAKGIISIEDHAYYIDALEN
jgi:hypothetical protein